MSVVSGVLGVWRGAGAIGDVSRAPELGPSPLNRLRVTRSRLGISRWRGCTAKQCDCDAAQVLKLYEGGEASGMHVVCT
jgi:hypothetical protein